MLGELRSERFVDASPAQVWATLLDEGRYLASQRTLYRLLAERPNAVWSWDISKLKGPATWTCFSLYVILDVFSRYCVGWTVQHRESAHVAKN